MTSLGKRLIKAAKEASAIARGDAELMRGLEERTKGRGDAAEAREKAAKRPIGRRAK
jgi:hypothetical protein